MHLTNIARWQDRARHLDTAGRLGPRPGEDVGMGVWDGAGYYLLGGTKVVTRVLWSEGCDPACIRDPTIERYPLSVNR